MLKAVDLAHTYGRRGRILERLTNTRPVRALDGVTVEVSRGETVAVVGETGSGKTTLARCLVGLLQPVRGEIHLKGQRLPSRPTVWPRDVRRSLQMVFQNPELTLNPRRSILDAVARPLELFGFTNRRTRRARATELLQAVRLSEHLLDRFPSELSGGERQRVAIARAFACKPDVILCDEPTSALDVSVQAAILNLLLELQQQQGISYLFISHDLAVVRRVADRIVVLYLGKVCEVGRTEDAFNPPHHPYTEALLSAAPRLMRVQRHARIRLEGPTPNPASPPAGCPFHPCCPRKIGAICEEQEPPLIPGARGHAIACHIPPDELLRLQSAQPAGATVIVEENA